MGVSFRNGDAARSQSFMRARVGLQAATVALMVATGGLEMLRSTDDVLGTLKGGFSKACDQAFGKPEPSRSVPPFHRARTARGGRVRQNQRRAPEEGLHHAARR